MTSQDSLAHDMRAALAAAERQRDEALQTLARHTHFIVAASHDLRQPLHALSLYAKALESEALPASAAPLLQGLRQALTGLETLFDDLLDAARVDDRRLAPQPQAVSLQALYERVAAHAAVQAFDKGLALHWRGGHRQAWADPLLLERMLRNLVHNALRYTEDGGVVVACRTRGEGLSLQVWDSGRGIAAEELPRLFEPYAQAAGAMPRHGALGERGWGLGLFIVRRLAVAQGIELSVRSAPGRGSVFKLALKAPPSA